MQYSYTLLLSLQIIANGNRKMMSSKVSISLGNYYGRPADGSFKACDLKARLYRQYDKVFCKYALAFDRLSKAIRDLDCDDTSPLETSNKVFKAYRDCFETQLSLNHIFHSLNFYEDNITPNGKENIKVDEGSIDSLSHDFMRVLIECIIETLLLAMHSRKTPNQLEALDVSTVNLNLATSMELFKSFCIHGSMELRLQGSMLLQCLCETQAWWSEYLLSSFKYCFQDNRFNSVFKER